MDTFRARVYEIVRSIPPGRVMTYGSIGALIPPPKTVDGAAYERIRARWVGYALSDAPQGLPWHRVVNAQGRISARHGLGPLAQRALLEGEGVAFDPRGQLELATLRWDPAP